MDGGRAVTWQGDRGAGRGSPCASLAIAGMVAGTLARGPLTLDEEMARVVRLDCTLTTVLLGVWTGSQWLSASLNECPQLGAPWFLVAVSYSYPLWTPLRWWVAFGPSLAMA